MNKKQEKKVATVLLKLYDIVLAEEQGSAEHICEYFDSEELEELINEIGIKIKPSLEDCEIEEAVDDFLDEYEWVLKCHFDEEEALDWASENTSMNKADKELFIEELKKRLK
jgi:hypothetical protein